MKKAWENASLYKLRRLDQFYKAFVFYIYLYVPNIRGIQFQWFVFNKQNTLLFLHPIFIIITCFGTL